MNNEKISKLAVELLVELSRGSDPEDEVLLHMAELRLKTLLVWSLNKKQTPDYDQRDSAIQYLY